MKLHATILLSCVVATASYAPLTHAAECSAAQQAAANVLGADAEFQKSCPDVFDDQSGDGSSSLDVASISSLDGSALASLAPCQKDSCAAYLKSKANAVPDCEISGVNARVVFNTIVDFCGKRSSLEAGSLDDGSLSEAVFVTVGGSSSGSSGSSSSVPSAGSSTPAASTASPAVGEKEKDAATNANTKSDANSAAFAGATAIVAGFLLTVLCM